MKIGLQQKESKIAKKNKSKEKIKIKENKKEKEKDGSSHDELEEKVFCFY